MKILYIRTVSSLLLKILYIRTVSSLFSNLFFRFSGVAAFNFYAVSIFQASFDGGLLNPHLAAVITGTVQLLASALSGLLSDLIGRLPLLLLTLLLMSAALGGFGFYSFYRESITGKFFSEGMFLYGW